MGRRRLLLVVGVAVPIIAVLGDLLVNAASSQARWPGLLEELHTHPWQSLAVVTIVVVGLGTVAKALTEREPPPPDLGQTADRLAGAIHDEWSVEATRRKVYEPYAMPVSWVPADTDLVTPWSTVLEFASSVPSVSATARRTWARAPSQLAGTGNEIINVLHRVPSGRLVVLGEPGAGKTILLVRLMLALLSERVNGGPVPILLPLASWNPEEEDLESWIVRWLTTDRSALAGTVERGADLSLARALINRGLILPVLDGFDEIPEAARGYAIARINESMRHDGGLILASRTEAYRAAVQSEHGKHVRLAGAAGIQLRPLEAKVVTRYLRKSAEDNDDVSRWNPIITALNSPKMTPVRQSLTTPLMVSLARAIYDPQPEAVADSAENDPSELLNQEAFQSSTDIDRYLFGSFLGAAYRPSSDPSHSSQHYRWTANQAERWLTMVAVDLKEREGGTTDIAWWRLSAAAPKHLAQIIVMLVAGFGAAFYPFIGFGIALILSLPIGLAVRRMLPRAKSSLTRAMAGGLVGGGLAALIGMLTLGLGVRHNLEGAFLAGGLSFSIALSPVGVFSAGLVASFAAQTFTEFYEHSREFYGIRTAVGPWSHAFNALGLSLVALVAFNLWGRKVPSHAWRLRFSIGWFGWGLASGIVIGLVSWLQIGWVAGVVIGIVTIVVTVLAGSIGESVTTDLAKASDPMTVLRRDRGTFLASCLGFGLALGIAAGAAIAYGVNTSGRPNGLAPALETGFANLIGPGLAYGFIQAPWGEFAAARVWLALRRQLPLRVMTFFKDAHVSRNALIQVGAVYQFPHVELQRCLADKATPQARSIVNAAHSKLIRLRNYIRNFAWTVSRRALRKEATVPPTAECIEGDSTNTAAPKE